jgi:hypothetical protein
VRPATLFLAALVIALVLAAPDGCGRADAAHASTSTVRSTWTR